MKRKEIQRMKKSFPNLVRACEEQSLKSLRNKKEEALINSASADSVRAEKLRRERYKAGGRYYG